MLDDLFQADNIAAARDAAMRPPPVPKQAASFSAWKTLTAAPRGVTAGVAQTGGFFSDVLGAFGQALDATGTAGAGGMFGGQTQAERQSSDAAAAKMRREGLDFNSEAGDSFRSVARGYSPDPETAHAAERLVFDFARFASKAVGYSVAAGPLVGAGLTGADEALTASDDLRLQGVDLGTRSAAGAVIGAASALGVGLPMAGRTALGTTGLVALGGPGAFMAQQAGVRKILQDADYSKLAEQYDPFDPVGLAVSTLVPAGFGAWAMRGAKTRAAKVKPAEAIAEPMKPAEAPRAEVSPEVQDAARVVLADMERARANPLGSDVRVADAHEAAFTRAADQIARGERVAVDDLMPAQQVRPEAVAPGVVFDSGANNFIAAKSDAGMVGGHVRDGALRITYAEVSPEMRGKGEGIKLYSAIVDKALADGLKVFSDSTVEAAAVRVYEALKRRGYEVQRLDGGEIDGAVFGKGAKEPAFQIVAGPTRESSPAVLHQFAKRIQTAGRAIEAELPKPTAPKEPPRAAEPAAPRPQAAEPAPAAPATSARAAAPAPGPDVARPSGTGPKAGLVDDGAALRVAEIEAAQPDMLVQLDGMDAPKPLSEVMAAVKAEADDLIADGDLMQQAAVCALFNGQ